MVVKRRWKGSEVEEGDGIAVVFSELRFQAIHLFSLRPFPRNI